MPHAAAATLVAWLSQHQGVKPSLLSLDSATATAATAGLSADGVGLFYSGCVSFSEAIRGLQLGNFSWATVKLYYACFYAVRSLLCFNQVSLFYVGRTPYSVVSNAGSHPRKEKGNSHEVVWAVLSRDFPNHQLLGDIENAPAYEWMKNIREIANYREPKFVDPNVPVHFSSIDTSGLSASIDAYRSDSSMLYAFDPDHAAVAYPVECLKRAFLAFNRAGNELSGADLDHVADCLSAGMVTISPLPWE